MDVAPFWELLLHVLAAHFWAWAHVPDLTRKGDGLVRNTLYTTTLVRAEDCFSPGEETWTELSLHIHYSFVPIQWAIKSTMSSLCHVGSNILNNILFVCLCDFVYLVSLTQTWADRSLTSGPWHLKRTKKQGFLWCLAWAYMGFLLHSESISFPWQHLPFWIRAPDAHSALTSSIRHLSVHFL